MARYLVYGAGAIGSILGAELCRTGQDLVLVARPDGKYTREEISRIFETLRRPALWAGR